MSFQGHGFSRVILYVLLASGRWAFDWKAFLFQCKFGWQILKSDQRNFTSHCPMDWSYFEHWVLGGHTSVRKKPQSFGQWLMLLRSVWFENLRKNFLILTYTRFFYFSWLNSLKLSFWPGHLRFSLADFEASQTKCMTGFRTYSNTVIHIFRKPFTSESPFCYARLAAPAKHDYFHLS